MAMTVRVVAALWHGINGVCKLCLLYHVRTKWRSAYRET